MPLGVNGAVRDETLLQLSSVQVMFVQGSKDALCPLDRLGNVRRKMKCYSLLHVVDGGDHSFKIGKKLLQSKASSQAEAEEQTAKAIADFVSNSIATKAALCFEGKLLRLVSIFMAENFLQPSLMWETNLLAALTGDQS
ncbi:hypothetical protein ACLOJK_010171 [Asimina triloba]